MSFGCCCSCADITMVAGGAPLGSNYDTFTPPNVGGGNMSPPPPYDISGSPTDGALWTNTTAGASERGVDCSNNTRYFSRIYEEVLTADSYTCDGSSTICGNTEGTFRYRETWEWDSRDGRLVRFKQEHDDNVGSYSTTYEWTLDDYAVPHESGTYDSSRAIQTSGRSCSIVVNPASLSGGDTFNKTETGGGILYEWSGSRTTCGTATGDFYHSKGVSLSSGRSAATAISDAQAVMAHVDLFDPSKEYKLATGWSGTYSGQLTTYSTVKLEDIAFNGTPTAGRDRTVYVGKVRHYSEGVILAIGTSASTPTLGNIAGSILTSVDNYIRPTPTYFQTVVGAASLTVDAFHGDCTLGGLCVKSLIAGDTVWCGEHCNGTTDYCYTTPPTGKTIEANVYDGTSGSIGPTELVYDPGIVYVQPCSAVNGGSCGNLWDATPPAGCSC